MGYATYGVKDKAWHLKKHTADNANSDAVWTSLELLPEQAGAPLPALQHARALHSSRGEALTACSLHQGAPLESRTHKDGAGGTSL